MAIDVFDGGAWRNVTEQHVFDGGAWRRVWQVWERDGGVWRLIDQYMSLTFASFIRFGAPPQITFQRDGDVTILGSGGAPGADDWILPRSASVGDDYEVRGTLVSGAASSYESAGVWLPLTTNRTFGYNNSAFTQGNWTFEIRHAANNDIIAASAQIQITEDIFTP